MRRIGRDYPCGDDVRDGDFGFYLGRHDGAYFVALQAIFPPSTIGYEQFPTQEELKGRKSPANALRCGVILGDHELASWVDAAVKRSLVLGTPECLDDLKKRLDRVMAPLPDATSAEAATALPTATTSAA